MLCGNALDLAACFLKTRNASIGLDGLLEVIFQFGSLPDSVDIRLKNAHRRCSKYFGLCNFAERSALKAIDMDQDGTVDWNEFAVYLKWAGNQYPDTKTSEDLLDIAFRQGLLPAMQDTLIEISQQKQK